MSAPRQMTASTLNALKGWPRPNALDFEGKFDPSTLAAGRVAEGSVGHLNASGLVVLGVGNLAVMPLFNFQASDDYDVQNDGGDAATDKGVYIAINPTGVVMFLVATGAYELVTTNFDNTITYTPNATLTSPTVATGAVNPGTLTGGTIGTNTICGIVSRGVIDNGYGYDALAFWPVFLPPNA
jgi:hypothetical protein